MDFPTSRRASPHPYTAFTSSAPRPPGSSDLCSSLSRGQSLPRRSYLLTSAVIELEADLRMNMQELIPTQTDSRRADSGEQPPAQVGALVVGGGHPGPGGVRTRGRRGIPVYVIDSQHCISNYSRYAKRVVRVDNIL